MKNNKMKQGFTLVELSIVLVIIGLLIGGILVAQSLIDSTRLQSFTRAVGQYDAAVGVFIDRFGDLPGDNTLFGTTGADGDGTIEGTSDALGFSGEAINFWADLGHAGMKNEGGNDFTRVAAGTAATPTAGTDVPEVAIGTNAVIVPYAIAGANFYHVAGFTTTTATADALSAADALAVDIKLDDGAPHTGDVLGSVADVMGANAATKAGTPGAAECYFTATTYNVAADGDLCQLEVRIGTVTGNLQ